MVLSWWCGTSPLSSYQAIICDGAVRSGKTICIGLSFFFWAMRSFHRRQFALCGKTIASVRRNLLNELMPMLSKFGFRYRERRSQNSITVRFSGRENTFTIFGGKDEGSAALIQGMTLAGVMLDEVALMPRTFVEQAVARCSVEGAKLWFTCNPEGPEHWFYKNWILGCKQKNALYIHFTMSDNPSLSKKMIERYHQLYSGAFFQRYVLGLWVCAEGKVYDFFDDSFVAPVPDEPFERFCISCDYGTLNPASFGLWALKNGTWFRVKEYYYDARKEGASKTDLEYVEALRKLAGSRKIDLVVVDPSAASFIEALRRGGFHVVKAKNEVLEGIRKTAALLRNGKLVICETCTDAIREFRMYSWDTRISTHDQVRKEYDHAMDEIRYFAATVASGGTGPAFSVSAVERGAI